MHKRDKIQRLNYGEAGIIAAGRDVPRVAWRRAEPVINQPLPLELKVLSILKLSLWLTSRASFALA